MPQRFAIVNYPGLLLVAEPPWRWTLSVDKGTLKLLYPDPNGGVTYLSGDGTEDASMSFVGTTETINSALQWISYQPEGGATGEAAFTITTNDLGNVGTDGAKSDTDVITINVNPVPTFATSLCTPRCRYLMESSC